ncbi:MAG: hypothetical protein GT600_10800 [Bacteroidales bacterium]|jgi:hypothetical protein|nr:hypothetical protein [Bacteroidales bacterium]NMD02124.1 hypothetical protein [Bacteroidales bacterium]OQB61636.1 MAG: hypothetical protein BWX96_01740 [Bacteroidetes bacterium ADurb.Bin145]HOU01427.1 hypothetical protein [Bacteroidales bacterium]HQK68025.1 hypothetical protein [Bacteroidales bacterium]
MKNKGEILASVLRKYDDCLFFLHNTREFSIVEKIMNEGFIFENQLLQSTDQVNPNQPIEITYFLLHRKEYGPYTVVIAIPKDIYRIYSDISDKNNTGIEEVITITEPRLSENDELIYTLSPRHILGYFNTLTTEFSRNLKWDNTFNNTDFRSPSRKREKQGRRK